MPLSDSYPGALPFASQYSSGLSRLYDETLRSQAPQQDVNAARDVMRRETALRGINGPLAAGMVGGAANSILSDFNKQRAARLMQIFEMMRAAQGDEARRRADTFAANQAGKQANRETGEAWGRGIGTGLGALTFFIPGVGPAIAPLAAGAGSYLGGSLGGSIADWTYGR